VLGATFFDSAGRFVVMEVVTEDTDGDGRLLPPQEISMSAGRRCRGRVASGRYFDSAGDILTQRIAPVVSGPVRDVPLEKSFDRPVPPSPRYWLVSQSATVPDDRDDLPVGPFHWQPAELSDFH
jgi:hypothetical protein